MAAPKKQSEQSFEKMFSELEAVVEKLEGGDLTLDESLALYERGMELARRCGAQLDRAELRIKELTPGADESVPEEDESDEEEGEE